jgi:hypothetical protein
MSKLEEIRCLVCRKDGVTVIRPREIIMPRWFGYAVGAALLYGAHQVFTKLAASRISDGLGGFIGRGDCRPVDRFVPGDPVSH